jgi:hypothetical protein
MVWNFVQQLHLFLYQSAYNVVFGIYSSSHMNNWFLPFSSNPLFSWTRWYILQLGWKQWR